VSYAVTVQGEGLSPPLPAQTSWRSRPRRAHFAVRALLPAGRIPGWLQRRADRDRGRPADRSAGGRREVLHGPARWRSRVSGAPLQAFGEDVRVPDPRPGLGRDSYGGEGADAVSLAP